MQIGVLAKTVDCHVATIRYYERIGLLTPPERKANGYRCYTKSHLQRVRLIRRAHSLGFSQGEVRNLVLLTNAKENPCDRVHQITLQQIGVIDTKLKKMRRIKKALHSLANACENGTHERCPVLEELITD